MYWTHFWIFTIVMSCFLSGLFVWTWLVKGSFNKAKEHWKTKQLFGDMKPLLWLPALAVLILSLLFSPDAAAEQKPQISYLNWIEAEAGLEWQIGEVEFVQCKPNTTDDLDKLGSNLGARLNLIEIDDSIQINAKYTHHSCAVETDRLVYDAVGLQIVWRFNFND